MVVITDIVLIRFDMDCLGTIDCLIAANIYLEVARETLMAAFITLLTIRKVHI